MQDQVSPSEQEVLAGRPQSVSPMDLPVEVFQAGLQRRRQNRQALLDWLRQALVDGVDYGSVPSRRGPGKPSLWKPGAEKICGMLGVTVHFPTLGDYEQTVLTGISLQQVIIRCEIRDAQGGVVADGVGARNLKQDQGDLNKALKMAEKSAMIDATLRLAGLSEIFTQDLEDMPRTSCQADNTRAEQQLSSADIQLMLKRIDELGLNKDKVRAWLISASKGAVEQFEQLNHQHAQMLSQQLDRWAERIQAQARQSSSPSPAAEEAA